MKANELMIDDWVYNKNIDKPMQIYPMIFSQMFRSNPNATTEDYNIFPVPLTTEILEKNGFEKVLDEDGTECHRYYNSAADGYIKISLYNGGDGDWSIEIINYEKFDDNEIVHNNNFTFLKVHQLQHALRLCGIDKEIEL